MDVHKESISIAVRNDVGKIVMECGIETKANILLDFLQGLRGELQVTFEEGTGAAWLYDLLKPHVTKLVVCDPRKNSRQRNQCDEKSQNPATCVTLESSLCNWNGFVKEPVEAVTFPNES
jgi:hypothetical protein